MSFIIFLAVRRSVDGCIDFYEEFRNAVTEGEDILRSNGVGGEEEKER